MKYIIEIKHEIKTCDQCPLSQSGEKDGEYYCGLAPESNLFTKVWKIPDWCPLVKYE